MNNAAIPRWLQVNLGRQESCISGVQDPSKAHIEAAILKVVEVTEITSRYRIADKCGSW
jgi:hypothetical protein